MKHLLAVHHQTIQAEQVNGEVIHVVTVRHQVIIAVKLIAEKVQH